ncbi:MAG: hypothetical protein KGM49_03815 [Sphingomonadales bacterium]|nr:hypothetical protein [Sphingomonadales bacterium]
MHDSLPLTPARPIPQTHERHWSRTKMARFLTELAATHSVALAARVVGMSRQSAYRLKARLRDQPFDLAWEAAVQSGYDALHQAALDRALNGVEVPVHHKGELVGSRRMFDERLTVFLLSARNRFYVPHEAATRTSRGAWAGYFAHLVAQVRSGANLRSLDGDFITDEGDA